MSSGTSKATKSGLTPLQEAFCHEYLIDFDAGQAYVRAGYKARPDFAAKNGSRLMGDPKIIMRIQELIEQRARVTDVTAERVILELGRIAFSDLRNYMSWDEYGAAWRASEKLSDDAAAAIAEIYETERDMEDGGTYRTKRFKLHDKMTALRELAKHTGISGPAGTGVNVNVNVSPEAEREQQGEMEKLFADIDEWREDNALPEEKPEVADKELG